MHCVAAANCTILLVVPLLRALLVVVFNTCCAACHLMPRVRNVAAQQHTRGVTDPTAD